MSRRDLSNVSIDDMTEYEFLGELAALLGVEPENRGAIQAAVERAAALYEEEFVRERLETIIAYTFPDRNWQGGDYKPRCSGRALQRPHPALADERWWNAAFIGGYYRVSEDPGPSDYSVDLKSYIGGGENSATKTLIVPAAWMNSELTNEQVFALIDAHAEEGWRLKEQAAAAAKRASLAELEAREQAEYRRLQKKYGA